MGIEDEIRSYIARGYTPQQIIGNLNFKKSTVYKVYSEDKMRTSAVTPSMWSAEAISLDRGLDGRYLPGDTATVGFSVVNRSPSDLYMTKAGVQPEWMERYLGFGSSEWVVQEGSVLLRPGERRVFRVPIEIPAHLSLGEYNLRFGIEGQFLSMGMPQYGPGAPPLWTDPLVFHVQYPITDSVFFSHSTKNMSLVRQLEKCLDDFGVHCTIAEDIGEPGRDLREKFHYYIDQNSFFLGLLTQEAVMSAVVIDEVEYALLKKKPGIYLVEEGIEIPPLSQEWASRFSRQWPVEQFVTVVLDAIASIRKRGLTQNSFPSGPVIAGVAAFFLGLAVGRPHKK